MKKLFASAAIAVALIAPAKAQNFSAEDVRQFAAALVGYQVKCGPLGPNAYALMLTMTNALEKSEAAAAAINMNAHIEQFGVAKWCAGMKDVVTLAERGGR